MLATEWKEIELGQAITLQRGFDLPHRDRRPGNVPIVTSAGIGGTHDVAKVPGPGVITGRYGTIGEVFYVEEDYWPLNTTLYVKDFKGNDQAFIALLLRTIDFRSHSGKSGVPGVNRNDLHELLINLPPLVEQRAIALVLSDVDGLISGLDQLIAKKRDLKQAAMQRLLTGKERLPGFGMGITGFKQTEVGLVPEEWEVKSCGEICLKIQDGTHFSPTPGGSDYLYVTSKNIGFGFLDLSSAERINAAQHKDIYRRCDVRQGDILLTKDGANTGNAALNTLREEFSLLSSVAFLRFDNELHDPHFYLQQILSTDGQRRIKEAMVGNAITRLTLDRIRKLHFATPPVNEQRAIARVLSDMDADIEALEHKREKTRLLKQGMMQELLTGRTRLV